MSEAHSDIILIIGETAENLKTLLSILAKSGYAVRMADSGKQSLEKARLHSPSLILLNRLIPDMSAYDLISQIMAIASDLQSALETVIEKIAELLTARDVGVALVDRIRKKFTIVAHHKTQKDENKLVNFELPDTAIAEKLMVNGESVIISDAQNNALIQPVRDIIRSRGIESLMVVPLEVSGNILGIIMVSTDSKNANLRIRR